MTFKSSLRILSVHCTVMRPIEVVFFTAESGHMAFHVIASKVDTGESMHGLLKSSSRAKTVLLVVDPMTNEQLFRWDFETVSKVTVSYERAVSLSVFYKHGMSQVTDEVFLFTHCRTILREFREFLETFMQVRVADRWQIVRISTKPASRATPRSLLSDCASISYEFSSASPTPLPVGQESPVTPARSTIVPPVPPVNVVRPGVLPE
eukprot:m.185849 g.185849  ORF g.185849 m.185849 type:complete len:207 (+) comp39337_c0_seq86:522-1142(+)